MGRSWVWRISNWVILIIYMLHTYDYIYGYIYTLTCIHTHFLNKNIPRKKICSSWRILTIDGDLGSKILDVGENQLRHLLKVFIYSGNKKPWKEKWSSYLRNILSVSTFALSKKTIMSGVETPFGSCDRDFCMIK